MYHYGTSIEQVSRSTSLSVLTEDEASSLSDEDFFPDFSSTSSYDDRRMSDSLINNNFFNDVTTPSLSSSSSSSITFSSSFGPASSSDESSLSSGEEEAVPEDGVQRMVTLLHGRLRAARDGGELADCSAIFLPPGLLRRVADDIVRMSWREPGGLRGCAISLAVERRMGRSGGQGQSQGSPDLGGDRKAVSPSIVSLGRLEWGSELASTFELQLTLIEDAQRWPSMSDIIALLAHKVGGRSVSSPLYISPVYRLVTKHLYRFA